MADAVILGTGGYGNVYYLSTNAKGSNVTAIWRAHKRGALFANPCYTQIHPTCIPVSGDYQSKLTLMSESLRNDGRIWVPKKKGDKRPPDQIPEAERDYYLERRYPSFGNLVPRDVASRNAKDVCDEGRGVGETGLGVYLDFTDAIQRLGEDTIRERYGNLFDMYQRITDENPYKVPMRIYPAIHYTMGGLWVDYNLHKHHSRPVRPRRSQLLRPRCQPAGRQRADAGPVRRLLHRSLHRRQLPGDQQIAEGRRTAPEVQAGRACVQQTIDLLLSIKGKRTVDSFHRELGKIMWDYCGMSRTADGLEIRHRPDPRIAGGVLEECQRPRQRRRLEPEPGEGGPGGRLLRAGELMCIDALDRKESCGGHFREEYQTPEGEAQRDDEHYSYVAAWDYRGPGNPPTLTKEPLEFHYVHPSQRSYK